MHQEFVEIREYLHPHNTNPCLHRHADSVDVQPIPRNPALKITLPFLVQHVVSTDSLLEMYAIAYIKT